MSPSERDDPRSTEELVQVALEGDEDDERAWAAIRALRQRGTREVLEAARRLLGAPFAKARGRGADILGQLGGRHPAFPQECGDALLALLTRETEPAVLLSAGVALGHLQEPRALTELVRLSHHPSAEARYGAAHGLAVLDAPEAIAALIRLSADEDRDVRDRATFALGMMQDAVDTPELREALAARLSEPDADIFGEALVGLAIRGDPRALAPTRAALSGGPVTVYVLEAAAALGEPDLYPLLLALRDAPGEADAYFRSVLEEVLGQFAQLPRH